MQVLIIGGGPAGCAAAIWACRQGFSVELIDVPVLAKRIPGETLHPGVEPILRKLGVWTAVEACGFHRHAGVWRVGLDGARSFEPYGADDDGPWQGLQVDRLKLHKILRDEAISLGTRWAAVASLSYARHDSQGWTIASVSGEQFTAPIVMDGTGRRAWFAAQLRLRFERRSVPERVQFGWSSATTDTGDGNPEFRLLAEGWDWSAPVGGGKKAWVRLRCKSDMRGVDLTPRVYKRCAGEDWFLLGDAACLTTPASGNGVLRALMSGIYAVHCLTAINRGALPPRGGADAYCSWVHKFWESSVAGSAFSSDQPHML